MNRINCSKFFLLLKPPESPFNPLSTNPKNGQTHSAFANELFECVWPFCRVGAYRVNLQLTTLFKKRLRHRFFSVNFVNFFKNIFFMEHLLETASERRVLRKLANYHFCYKEISWNLQLFQRTDVAREGEVCDSHLIKGNIVLKRNFLYMLVKRRQNS